MDEHIIKKERSKRIFNIFLLLLLGVIYLLITKCTRISISCPIYSITGLYCPGCGISRLIIHISQGQFYMAFRSNMAIFILSPMLMYLLFKYIFGYINNKNKITRIDMYIVYFCIIVLVLFMIFRNITYFSYLQPI